MPDPQLVHLVVGPPRSASTALCRVVWNHPAVRYYVHEPYESTYFKGLDTSHATAAMERPLDLVPVAGAKSGAAVLVKEISFQLGGHLPHLLAQTAHPVVFLIRDPRLTISSRRRVKEQQGVSPDFPLVETGWQDLVQQVEYCRAHDVPHLVVDSFDIRSHPVPVLTDLFAAWNLVFDPAQLQWEPQPELMLSNYRVTGVDHFFTRVLNSDGLQLPVEVPVPVADFPPDDGLREHLHWALEQYADLRRSPQFLGVRSDATNRG